ncbi:MAG: hypothetical protein EHM78_02305 [Myxococcaceae bacterium]|nr:MAG: hypothetical protein EHM78_02305 [Myxococcaceae bacterium]
MSPTQLEGVSVGDVWYRVEDRRYAGGVNEFGTPDGPWSSAVVVLFIRIGMVHQKSVRSDDGRLMRVGVKRQWAWPTYELARADFLRRKAAQKSILSARIRHIEKCLRTISRRPDSADVELAQAEGRLQLEVRERISEVLERAD